MPSTYTPALRITKPAQGEHDDTWGNIVNDEITSLLETAIAGYTSIALTDANTTLSTANGTADQARSAMLNLTGTLTAARELVIPNVNKVYIIRNSTTGGFALSVKTSAGSAFSVPNGKIVVLCCDGADNVFEAVNYHAALTATTLTSTTHSTGSLTTSGAASIGTIVNFGVGAVGAPALAFTAEPSSGFYRQSAATWDMAIAGVHVHRLKANGFEVRAPAATAATINLAGNATTVGTSSFDVFQDTNSVGKIYSRGAFGIIFGTTNSGRWQITADGHFTPVDGEVYTLGSLALRPSVVYGVAGNFSGTVTATAFSGALSGNATTATSATSAVSVSGSTSNGYGTRTISSSAPSGGSDGDIWYQV
jgi:hypothetical protein